MKGAQFLQFNFHEQIYCTASMAIWTSHIYWKFIVKKKKKTEHQLERSQMSVIWLYGREGWQQDFLFHKHCPLVVSFGPQELGLLPSA